MGEGPNDASEPEQPLFDQMWILERDSVTSIDLSLQLHVYQELKDIAKSVSDAWRSLAILERILTQILDPVFREPQDNLNQAYAFLGKWHDEHGRNLSTILTRWVRYRNGSSLLETANPEAVKDLPAIWLNDDIANSKVIEATTATKHIVVLSIIVLRSFEYFLVPILDMGEEFQPFVEKNGTDELDHNCKGCLESFGKFTRTDLQQLGAQSKSEVRRAVSYLIEHRSFFEEMDNKPKHKTDGHYLNDDLITIAEVAKHVELEEKSMTPYVRNWGNPVVQKSGRRPARYQYAIIKEALARSWPEIRWPKRWNNIDPTDL